MTLDLYAAEPASVRVIGASPPSWACTLALREKGLPHRVIELSFERREHRAPEMLALNPRGTLPFLVDGDVVLYETLAVLHWLEHLAPGHLGAERSARARALLRLHEADALKSVGMQALGYLLRTAPDARERDVLRAHGAALVEELARWDAYLTDGPWVAGEALTIADMLVFPYVTTLRQLGLPLEPWPRLRAHHDRMAARPAAQQTRPVHWADEPATSPWPT